MPSAGKPKPYTRSAAQKLPHPVDLTCNAVHQAARGTAAVPAVVVMPTPADSTFDQVVQAAYDAKNGTDKAPQ